MKRLQMHALILTMLMSPAATKAQSAGATAKAAQAGERKAETKKAGAAQPKAAQPKEAPAAKASAGAAESAVLVDIDDLFTEAATRELKMGEPDAKVKQYGLAMESSLGRKKGQEQNAVASLLELQQNPPKDSAGLVSGTASRVSYKVEADVLIADYVNKLIAATPVSGVTLGAFFVTCVPGPAIFGDASSWPISSW